MITYKHTEAFALMWYACRCGHRERIWNSRDGVTPFGGLHCPSCGHAGLDGGMAHVDWQLDKREPSHTLAPGQQFFRDGTADDAVKIIERRIAIISRSGDKPSAEVLERVRADAKAQTGEWKPGWPMVDRLKEGL